MPWLLGSDADLVCLASGTEKKVVPFAEVICTITRTRGATEATVLDHDLVPMTKVGFHLKMWGLSFHQPQPKIFKNLSVLFLEFF